MHVFSIIYYSITFILGLFVINKLLILKDLYEGEREDIRSTIFTLCAFFAVWSLSVVVVGISSSNVIDKVFLLVAEFMKMCTFVSAVELCASLTDRVISKKLSIYSVSSELIYFGVLVLAVKIVVGRAETVKSYFGESFKMNGVNIFTNIFYYVAVAFFLGAYTYMHYYLSNTRRERYISKKCAVIVGTITVSLVIESVGYALFEMFLPSMYIGMLICIFIFRNLIIYKRSIEYNEADYYHILSPSHNKPAFVCDDEGKVLFENIRAFVMRQTYKDNYKERLLTEIFEITDYDKERLKEPRITQTFDIYCKYPREPKEMILTVKHNLDKFGTIFSTEVEVGYANVTDEDIIVAANNSNRIEESLIYNNVSIEELIELRTLELIKLLERQKKLYENGEKILFGFNTKGISKAAGVLAISALEELCDRIQTEISYGEWEALEHMMVDIDRQYETLVMLNS